MKGIKILFQIAVLKTLWINLRYFGYRFYKFPIIVYRHTCLREMGGKIIVDSQLRPGLLQIGRLRNGFQSAKDETIWNVHGTIILKGKASFGRGSRIDVGNH